MSEKREIFRKNREAKIARQEAARTKVSRSRPTNPELPFSPTRISKKLSQRKADLKQVRVKIEDIPRGEFDVADYKPFKFKVSRGNTNLEGVAGYSKQHRVVDVGSIYEPKALQRGGGSLGTAHRLSKGKTGLDKGLIRGALEEIKRRYPKAKSIGGMRITGWKQGSAFSTQSFNLPKTLGRIGKGVRKMGIVGTAMDFKDFVDAMKEGEKRRKGRVDL